jgi:hypothetical protein
VRWSQCSKKKKEKDVEMSLPYCSDPFLSCRRTSAFQHGCDIGFVCHSCTKNRLLFLCLEL